MLHNIQDTNARLEINQKTDLELLRKDILGCLKSTGDNATLNDATVKEHFRNASDLKAVSQSDIVALSQRLDHLGSQITKFAKEAEDVATEQAFLNSLRYRTMTDRYGNIMENSSKTFDWIFDGPSHQTLTNQEVGICVIGLERAQVCIGSRARLAQENLH